MVFRFRERTAVPTIQEPLPSQGKDMEAVVVDIAQQAGGLGRESAELNGTIEDLASLSARQAEAFKALIDDIEAMVKANRAIGEATQASNGSVRRARELVEEIGRGVIGVKDTLQEVAEAAGEITQIALQTRLVAFNATVEAKRAGEAGRGFAVVADAVKALASQVEKSSKQIVSAVSQLDGRIGELAAGIMSQDSLEGAQARHVETFHATVSEVEHGVQDIAHVAEQNLAGCARVMQTVGGLSEQVDGTARALQDARAKTEGFLGLSESLIEMTAESGIRTVDTPFIERAVAAGRQIGELFDEGVRSGRISAADLFDDQYRPVAGTNPEQFLTRFVGFTDEVLAQMLEEILGWSGKVVFALAADLNGFVPTNNRKYSYPQGKDPVWNKANCRNRIFFKGRTEMAAVRDQRKFLLQTYRRDMGGGKYVVMKHLSVPIWVEGRHWGALRIGYQF